MRTIATKPTDRELEHLYMTQYAYRGEDVVVNGNLLFELLKEIKESRVALKALMKK